MRESEPLASSSSYRMITTNRSLLWVTSFEYVHEGVTSGGGGVQYDRLIDVLTVQCHSVGLEIMGWSFSSLPVPQMIVLFNFHVSTSKIGRAHV